jgi:hypothetical protein
MFAFGFCLTWVVLWITDVIVLQRPTAKVADIITIISAFYLALFLIFLL